MFSYDRINGTPEKSTQSRLHSVGNSVRRKIMSRVLDFLNRI